MTYYRALALALLVGATACSDNRLPDPVYNNVVDTLVLGSVIGTPLSYASAYSVLDARLVRTDQSSAFDFGYVSDGVKHYMVPLDGFGLGGRSTNPGLITTSVPFASIASPPSNGYNTTDSVEVHVGDVLIARSRLCYLGVPQYAKIEVLNLDSENRFMTIQVLNNINCGYRLLSPGLPRE